MRVLSPLCGATRNYLFENPQFHLRGKWLTMLQLISRGMI